MLICRIWINTSISTWNMFRSFTALRLSSYCGTLFYNLHKSFNQKYYIHTTYILHTYYIHTTYILATLMSVHGYLFYCFIVLIFVMYPSYVSQLGIPVMYPSYVSQICIPVIYPSYVSQLCIPVMYPSYVSQICIPVMYPSYVSQLCIPVMYPSYVSQLCIPVMYPSYVSQLCIPVMYPCLESAKVRTSLKDSLTSISRWTTFIQFTLPRFWNVLNWWRECSCTMETKQSCYFIPWVNRLLLDAICVLLCYILFSYIVPLLNI